MVGSFLLLFADPDAVRSSPEEAEKILSSVGLTISQVVGMPASDVSVWLAEGSRKLEPAARQLSASAFEVEYSIECRREMHDVKASLDSVSVDSLTSLLQEIIASSVGEEAYTVQVRAFSAKVLHNGDDVVHSVLVTAQTTTTTSYLSEIWGGSSTSGTSTGGLVQVTAQTTPLVDASGTVLDQLDDLPDWFRFAIAGVVFFSCVACASAITVLSRRWRRPKPEQLAKLAHPPEGYVQVLALGTVVELQGLRSDTHLNGQCGRTVQWMPDRDYYVVELADGSRLSIWPINLSPVYVPLVRDDVQPKVTNPPELYDHATMSALAPGKTVKLQGLQSDTRLNGQRGRVIEWDLDRGCYVVEVAGGVRRSVLPINLVLVLVPLASEEPGRANTAVLAQGSVVELHGLQRDTHLNGQRGRIHEWDLDLECYVVELADGHRKSLWPSNLVLVLVPLVTIAVLAPGSAVVELHGFRAGTHLDGQRGYVIQWMPERDYYVVEMADGARRHIRPIDIVPVYVPLVEDVRPKITQPAEEHDQATMVVPSPGSVVEFQGLIRDPHLNGQRGRVVKRDLDRGCYVVALADGTRKSTWPINLTLVLVPLVSEDVRLDLTQPPGESDQASIGVLELGSVVELHGFQGDTHLNGQRGRVVGTSTASANYVVELADGALKCTWPKNLALVHMPLVNEDIRLKWAKLPGAPCPPPEGLGRAQSVHAKGRGAAIKRSQLPEAPSPPPTGYDQATMGVLAPGSVAELHGFPGDTHLNGQRGYVVQWMPDRGCYEIELADGTRQPTRPLNLTPVHVPPAAGARGTAADLDDVAPVPFVRPSSPCRPVAPFLRRRRSSASAEP